MIRAATATAPIALLLASALASPAVAQDVNEEGALLLQTQVKAIVGTTLLPATDAVAYRMDGAVTATPDGDHYDVVIPGLTVDIDGDAELRIEPTELMVTPLANGWNQATWSLQDVFTVANPNGSERLDIIIGSQRADVTVAPEYSTFMAADIALGDIRFETDDLPGTISLGELALLTTNEDLGSQTYDLAGGYTLSGLLIDLMDMEGVRVALGEASLASDVRALRMDIVGDLTRLGQTYAHTEPDAAFFTRLEDAVSAAGPGPWLTGFTVDLALSQVDAITPEGSGGLQSGAFSLGLEGLDQALGSISMALAMEGLSASDLPPDFLPAIPTTARLEMGLEALPAADLMEIARQAISTAAQSGPDNAMGAAGMGLMGLAMSSNPVLAIDSLYIEAPLGYLSGTGQVQSDMTSPMGAVGAASITVGGLPEMIDFLQSGMVPDGAEVAAALTLFAVMGRDETDASGMAVKVFDIEVTPTGQVLLNGNDLGPIMGQL